MKREPFNPLTMPLSGTRLIEASAGTGKTFSLAGLYLRLIVEKQAPVREILVITFTRAATQELRDRIRIRLSEAAAIARNPGAALATGEDKFAEELIKTTVKSGAESREAIARRLADAAHRMDEATITTIHGFSMLAAGENAFDSALPFDRGEQVDDRAVYDEVVADYWRAHALGDNPVTGFVDWWPNPTALDKELTPLRSRPHARLAGPTNKSIATFAKEARDRWKNDGKNFLEELRGCWDGGVIKKDKLKIEIEKLSGIEQAIALLIERINIDQSIPALPIWTAHLNDPDTNIIKKHMARGEALFNQPLARDLCELQPLAHLAALRDAHERIEATAAERKRERRQFSFADMISTLHAAVTDPEQGARLADALHATWPWALVDEFQDTDPLQYEILRRVHQNRDSGALLLVGDPKQAIYGFRGGDVFAYLQAVDDAAGSYSLDTNYRSTQGLLDAVEKLFRTPGDDAFLVDGIHYQTVTAGRKSERSLWLDGEVLAPMTLWHLAPQKTNKALAEAACRQACLAQIRQLLDPEEGGAIKRHDPQTGETREDAVQPRDIAILVNKNAQAADMQRALSRLGIAAVCLHQDSVFASGEARDVLQVLKAAARPGDEPLLRGALAGELLGCRQGDIIAMADDEARWQTQIENFQSAHDDWRANGVLAMLQPMIQTAAERLLTFEDGERRISNFLQLAELLAGAENKTFGMAGLLRRLRQAIQAAENGEGGDAEQLRLESDEALVRIATVHKAKGLEYPIVFVPFAPWLGIPPEFVSPAKPPHDFHDQNGRAQIDMIGSHDSRARAILEARAEALRLLYVALTRAEIACFMTWGAANGTANGPLASLLHREDGIEIEDWGNSRSAKPLDEKVTRERLNELSNRAGKTIAVEGIAENRQPESRLKPSAKPTGKARTDLPTARPPWSIYSFTRLVHTAADGPADAGAEDEIAEEHTAVIAPEPETPRLPELPGGVAFGSAVHALLESTDTWAWPAPDAPLTREQLGDVAAALRRQGITLPDSDAGAATVERTAELIRNTLRTPLPAIGTLADLSETARRTEMEFMLRLGDNKGGGRMNVLLDLLNEHGYAQRLPRERQASVLRGLMHGFIDLVAEHDGRFYVIDYKTNWLGDHAGDYTSDALKHAVRHHHYDLQYLIYTTALHRFLRERLSDYDPDQHLGGVFYLFLRGMAPDAGERGVYFDRPETALIDQLDRLLDAREHAA